MQDTRHSIAALSAALLAAMLIAAPHLSRAQAAAQTQAQAAPPLPQTR